MNQAETPAPARQASSTILESPEEVLTTMTRDGKRRWLYPVESSGRHLSRRRIVAWVLIIAYVALPLIPIGGRPAILLDFINREFALFGLVFYPTDTLLLMVFLIGILLSVILFTALLGRVWCGWGCPQTVYLELLFRPLEQWLEGGPSQQRRLDREGPNLRRFVKNVLFFLLRRRFRSDEHARKRWQRNVSP